MIDPKRLTEADKGREVLFRGRTQAWIAMWSPRFVFIRMAIGPHNPSCAVYPELLDFAEGTYQDGGNE